MFGSPQQRNLAEGVSHEQGMAFSTEVFDRALPVVEQTDTLLAIEPLSARTTNFIHTGAEGADLVARMNSPRFLMILDCLAMASETIPMPELIRTHHKLMVHFHANDPNRQGPGFGELDFVPIFQALADVDHQRWVSVEVFDFPPVPSASRARALATCGGATGSPHLSMMSEVRFASPAISRPHQAKVFHDGWPG